MAAHTPILMSHWDGVIDRNLFATRSMLRRRMPPARMPTRRTAIPVHRFPARQLPGEREPASRWDSGAFVPMTLESGERRSGRAPALRCFRSSSLSRSKGIGEDLRRSLTLKSVESLGEQSWPSREQSGALVTHADRVALGAGRPAGAM